MKQTITTEQLNELSDKGKERLRKWWKPQEGDLYWLDYYGSANMVWIDQGKPSFTSGFSNYGNPKYKGDYVAGGPGVRSVEEVRKAITKDWLPLLTIGQMIEFLDERRYPFAMTFKDGRHWTHWFGDMAETRSMGELADALWEAVKGELEK